MPDLTVSANIDTLLQSADYAAARLALGFGSSAPTTAGLAFLGVTNPSAITFPRVNADNSATLLNATDFKTALGITTFDPASPGPIGGTTPAAGTFTTLALSGGGYLNTDTGNLTLGSGGSGGNQMMAVNSGGFLVKVRSDVAFGWVSGSDLIFNPVDVLLRRHAANILGIDTDASGTPPILLNGSTGAITATNVFVQNNLGFGAGTGTASFNGTGDDGCVIMYNGAYNKSVYLCLKTNNILGIDSDSTGSPPILLDGATGAITAGATTLNGDLIFGTDNTYDIGASGANRPRNAFFSAVVNSDGMVANLYSFPAGSRFAGATNGIITLYNGGFSDFDRLQFGGTSSSFPALKRSSATLQCRLADDSDYALFHAKSYSVDGTAGATGGTFAPPLSITVKNGIVTAIS